MLHMQEAEVRRGVWSVCLGGQGAGRGARGGEGGGSEWEGGMAVVLADVVALGDSIRRRFSRGLPKKYSVLLKKLRKAKKECPMHEKPAVVKTHLRNMIIMPEMIGSVVGVYNGKSYVGVEIKAEMVSACLG